MKLLVIEDDDALARVLRKGLAGGGFAVDLARSTRDAERQRRVNQYDLFVLDLGLPDGDGLQLLKRLREEGSAAPVLILTARGSVDDRVEGLDAGADDYLLKPFAFPELLARTRALLRRGAVPVATPVMRVEDLEIDPARLRVARGSAEIVLTAKEFSILEYLVLHRGQIVTRSMLLEHCWDDSYEGLSNLVDVHVSRLRGKLDTAGGKALIRTVRGAGFILGGPDR